MSAPEPVGRAQRRELRRVTITYLLDGPPRAPQCGQAKAAARARAAQAAKPRPPKDSQVLKALARELQARTGRKYSACLAEVRALAAQAQPSQPDPADRPGSDHAEEETQHR
ncbi:hypothetical protein ACFU6S_18740 [Streptomyces sp. NPDC057456]|uniref:hypothetical protein n=1 Tax=Streptomyces sp. NPDC057456 TaxID=3346139 RepID=UPI003676781C